MGEPEFKFSVGQIVTHKGLVNERDPDRLWKNEPPIKIFIVERLRQECYGGVQNVYSCRLMGASRLSGTGITDKCLNFTEIELVEYPVNASEEK